jgi:hypothetical protein
MSPAPPSLPSTPPPLDAGRKQSPATGSRSAGTVRDVIGVERRSQDTLEARASEMCLVCPGSPAALRCCSPLCAPGAQRRGGRLGWNISVRRGRCGWVESGARIYIDEREKIYRFPHVSCSCFMCQQEAEHTPAPHLARPGPRGAEFLHPRFDQICLWSFTPVAWSLLARRF